MSKEELGKAEAKDDAGALRARIAVLEAELAREQLARTEAEEMALQAVANGQYSGDMEEKPSGNVAKQRVCTNPWERDEKKQKWVDRDIPLFFFRIDIPKSAGWELKTNGQAYFHGETYEVDLDTLRDLKSRVARCWDHEKGIHGSNENEFRKETHVHLRGAH